MHGLSQVWEGQAEILASPGTCVYVGSWDPEKASTGWGLHRRVRKFFNRNLVSADPCEGSFSNLRHDF